jgi:Protein of unknown function (DUF2950)
MVGEPHAVVAGNVKDGPAMTHTKLQASQIEEMPMSQLSPTPETGDNRLGIASCVLGLLLAVTGIGFAQQAGQKTFPSADDACQALLAAAQSGDKSALLDILGPAGAPIVSSSDDVQDKNNREEFVARYQQMHRLAKEPDGTTTLYIGAENWPVPLPLISKSGVWFFDTPAAAKEILFRRIGKNEFAAMEVLDALIEAENDYYSQPRDGKAQQYAQKFASDEGQHNGLYWKAAEGDPPSPAGPLVAYATGEGYGKKESEGPSPFHGYYYRILTAQGKSAPGGAKSYIVNGEMTGGFALLAYPADYRSSGVMTFIVGQDGVIYQKDLGAKTGELASAIKDYAPDKTWQKTD